VPIVAGFGQREFPRAGYYRDVQRRVIQFYRLSYERVSTNTQQPLGVCAPLDIRVFSLRSLLQDVALIGKILSFSPILIHDYFDTLRYSNQLILSRPASLSRSFMCFFVDFWNCKKLELLYYPPSLSLSLFLSLSFFSYFIFFYFIFCT